MSRTLSTWSKRPKITTKLLILAPEMNAAWSHRVSHSALLTVVGGLTEFGYNLGNLGWICINIRGNDPLGAEWRDARATLEMEQSIGFSGALFKKDFSCGMENMICVQKIYEIKTVKIRFRALNFWRVPCVLVISWLCQSLINITWVLMSRDLETDHGLTISRCDG